MTNIIRPWQDASEKQEASERRGWADQIASLYEQGDQITDYTVKDRRPLSNAQDIGLVDDVLDALQDPIQAPLARSVLRHALKEIAKATLIRLESQEPSHGYEPTRRGPLR